nr:hypothetical protein [Tanacetum cinerariifolium]
MDSYATDEDELPTEKVSQELVKEMSQTVDEAKLRKVFDEMLRQRCTSRDEHQYHNDHMQNFLKNDIVWESRKEILSLLFLQKPTLVVQSCQRDPKAPALSLVNQDMLYLKKAGSESRPSMLNKENCVPWSSRLLRYAKSRPNEKLIHNSILNGPYVRRMIAEPGDGERDVNVNETFHEQTDDELSERELKQIEADDQAIQTILLGFPKDIYAVVDSCETAQEIWLRVQQMMKGESIESYYHRFLKLMNDLKRNKHFPKKIASNMKFLNNLQPEWSRYVTIVHQTKDLHTADYTQLYDFLKYNQKEVDELKAERIAKIQDPLALMVNSNNLYASPAPHQDQSPFNQNFLQ